MRSATSYFNGTLYRKSLARFWPLWAAYGVIWLFCIPLNMLNTYFSRYTSSAPADRLFRTAISLPEIASFGLYLAAFFAILCAMAVFGYLYNSRSSCWFHALPMRREALFCTQYLAGLCFLLLPQLAVAGITAMVELAFLPMEQWSQAMTALLVWLLAQSGICLFFFSFAAFCAMFTGHILALPAFYGILNILAYVIYFLMDGLMNEFFYGYVGSTKARVLAEYLTPCAALKEAIVRFSREDGSYYYASSSTIAAYAVVGAVLALASLYVYRRCHAETAGDVVAIPLVRPLFKYGVSFCAGLCLGMFTTMFFGWYGTATLLPWVLFWSVIGYFAAEMLLKKSFRVLRAWKGAIVMPAVLLVLCLVCELDLFGVEARVPELNQVELLTVQLEMGTPNDDGWLFSAALTSPDDMQKFLELHQAIVDDRDRLDVDSMNFSSGDDYTSLQLIYTLKGGGSLLRRYNSIPVSRAELSQEGSVTYLAQQLLQDRALVAQAYNFEGLLNNNRLTGAWLYRLERDGEEQYECFYVDDYARQLWDAVQQDFAEGTIGVRYLFHQDAQQNTSTFQTQLNFGLEPIWNAQNVPNAQNASDGLAYTQSDSLTIRLTPNARHTLAVLDETGVFEQGYSLLPWEASSEDSGEITYFSPW